MSQANQKINSHIETYLDYYCGLSHAPGFAVLLQGQWGSGKTWFINKYREKLKEENHKCLYVSLYGMTGFSDIEDAFFRQLHPILSSKGMAVTGRLLKGLIKGTLKFDWDSDKKDDGALNVQVPEINLPEYLRNTDKAILIFDDLERCKIDLSNILGYINYFVEHQDLKVILIANEDELLKDCDYKVIKEKLIGKTFAVSLDFEGALENFITMANHPDVRKSLSDNTELIRDFYEKAEYENLRNLKQIVLDFERIFDVLPEKAKSQSELLKDLLRPLIAFSIEIKRGVLLPKNIGQLQEEYRSGASRRVSSRQTSNTVKEEVAEETTPLEKMLERYVFLNLFDPFPSKAWWQLFFDKGTVDVKELHQSIENSKYFQDENTPSWIRLWHFTDLSDNEFGDIINEVEASYANRDYVEIGVIKHIFGQGYFIHI
jgi:GTPase SAR1 family protein